MLCFKLLLISLCVHGCTFAQTLNDDYRLPQSVLPVRYQITLKPYMAETDHQPFTFDGTVIIEIEVKETTNQILIHSKGLQYKSQEIWSSNELNSNPLTSITVNETTSIITYTLPNYLMVGEKYFLRFIYTGNISSDDRGLYRSSFIESDNQTRFLTSSFFAPNLARNAFPSWDEPHFKANFVVNIIRPKSYISYSNTPRNQTIPIDDFYNMDIFEETPKMSTYLVAFLIAAFKERSNENYSVITRPEYYDQTEYAFVIGPKILDHLSNYLDVDYYNLGVSKLGHVALPDFWAGAMENWGLISYRENFLLYKEGSSPLSAKQKTTTILTHEQTHLWFGDLVTCDWWSYTWLNEGFANYFEFVIANEVDPTLEIDKQFVVNEVQTIMLFDATENSNPMNDINTSTPTLLSRNFNKISYSKAGSVIRMVKHVLGEENFQISLSNYLKQNKFQNSKPKDIFQHWIENFPQKFKGFATDFLESFTWQEGYPLINIQVSTDKTSFEITQKRFLMNPTDGSDVTLFYTVPFTFTTNINSDFTNTTTELFLPPSSSRTLVPLNTPIKWLIANIQEIGYYRVNYDETNWKQIRQALLSNGWSSIHELNRAQIVDDLFNLARANEISYDLALYILEYLSTETNYLPWTAALNGFSYLYKRFGTNTVDLSAFMLELTNKTYTTLGFNETSSDQPLDIFLRESIMQWSCRLRHEICIKTMKSYFQNMTTTEVPVNLRTVVYCVAMREGSENDYNFLVDNYNTTKVATELNIILSALGCVKQEELIEKHFDFILSNNVRLQDKATSLTSLYSNNNENVMPVFRIVTKNYSRLADVLGSYSSVASLISGISEYFTTAIQLDELRTFNSLYAAEFGTASSTLRTAEDTVRKNLDWSSRRLPSVTDYLKQISSGTSRLKILYRLIPFTLISIVMTLL